MPAKNALSVVASLVKATTSNSNDSSSTTSSSIGKLKPQTKKQKDEYNIKRKKQVDEAVESIVEKLFQEEVDFNLPSLATEIVNEMKQVIIDPKTKIGNMDIRNVKELHLGNLQMTKLDDSIMNFIVLEELWLNNNKLTKIDNLVEVRDLKTTLSKAVYERSKLKGCFGLKSLYLHNNRIDSLLGSSIGNLKHLQILFLHGNRLTDLFGVINYLSKLKYLTHLTLFDNPLCTENNYRVSVILGIPNLNIFDRIEITRKERTEAVKQLHPPLTSVTESKIAFGVTTKIKAEDMALLKKTSLLGESAKMIQKEALQIKKVLEEETKRKTEEEEELRIKTLKEAEIKAYKKQQEKFDHLEIIYKEFDNLLNTEEISTLIDSFIKIYHPFLKDKDETKEWKKKTVPRELLQDIVFNVLKMNQFINEKIEEEKENSSTKTVTTIMHQIEEQKAFTFFDSFMWICKLKAEHEYFNSQQAQKLLEKEKAEAAALIEEEEKQQQERATTPKSPKGHNNKLNKSTSSSSSRSLTRPPPKKETKVEEEKEIGDSKRLSFLELQAASKAIKWETKLQAHLNNKPKEIILTTKRTDVYKGYYL
ncbi:hypothetical protein ABK040_016539 [Willaertia magna]